VARKLLIYIWKYATISHIRNLIAIKRQLELSLML